MVFSKVADLVIELKLFQCTFLVQIRSKTKSLYSKICNWTKSAIQLQDRQLQRKQVDQNYIGMHMSSRDNLFQILNWIKNDIPA